MNQGDTTPEPGFAVSPPAVSLPKGGGAVCGIGEKFSAHPVTGTGSLSVPIFTSPGRGGSQPSLTLAYDSGAGNGPFGLGWNLSLPSIARKTDKGLPRYLDAFESDTFILAGAEDLVPVLDEHGNLPEPQRLTVYGRSYLVRAYRPRIEGGYALIERWVEATDAANHFWRALSRDNVTSWFGRTPESRVADPADPLRVFEWRLVEQSDDRGNVMSFDYRREDGADIDLASLAEANRLPSQRTANTYLHAIRYGNTVPYLPTLATTGGQWPTPDDEPAQQWMFEVVFDYGDHAGPSPTTQRSTTAQHSTSWLPRRDAFSTHRPGFEVRTYRLCRRVLMFHHFEAELGARDYLVRSTDFSYAEPDDPANPLQAGYSVLTAITQRAYQKRTSTDTAYESRQWPPLEFSYSRAQVDPIRRSIDRAELENLPVGTQGAGYQWVDLDGEGLAGVLTEQAGNWFYKPNYGNGTFGPLRALVTRPAMAALNAGEQRLLDLAGDGELELVDFSGPLPGFHEREGNEGWKRFVPFASLPNIDWNDHNLRFVDLTGDGLADALITEGEVFTWHPAQGERGFGAAERVSQPPDENSGPRLVFADGTLSVFLADMTGDGLADLVRVRNGDVCFWPNEGYGRFGRKVSLANAPRFDRDEQYDPRRIRLGDVDGSGPADIVYLGADRARVYFNRSGNSLSAPLDVDLPVATHNVDAVQLADLLGNGTACLVWNSTLPGDAARPVWYINLMGGGSGQGKPHLLIGVNNNLGATTSIEYTPSTRFYIDDRRKGTPWITRLPFPVHCVSRVVARDRWRDTEFSTSFSYHHGYFDAEEREFRGFGRVEQIDVEDFGKTRASSPYVTEDETLHQPPVKTVTWYHTGAATDGAKILSQFEREYFPARHRLSGVFREKVLSEPDLPSDLTSREWREALRACKGMVLRQEVYELDLKDLAQGRETATRIFSAATHNCRISIHQRRGNLRHAVFQVTEHEALSYEYDLMLPRNGSAATPDPRVSHTVNLRHDEQGNAQQTITIGYGRWQPGDYAELPRQDLIASIQAERHLSYAEFRHTGDVVDDPPRTAGVQQAIRHRRLRMPCETFVYELKGFAPAAPSRYFEPRDFAGYDLSELYGHRAGEAVPPRVVESKQYHEYADGSRAQKRLIERTRTLFFDDASDVRAPEEPLPFGQHGPRGMRYESYKLALTDELLGAVFVQRDADGTVVDDKLAWTVTPATGGQPAVTARETFDRLVAPGSSYLESGYIAGVGIDASLTGEYWMRSGTAGFAEDAHRHFFQPELFVDPFGNVTTLEMDSRDLWVSSSTDACGNSISVEAFDYRVLSPSRVRDANLNESAVAFDIRGLPVASAQRGKVAGAGQTSETGDDVTSLSFDELNPSSADIAAFLSRDYSSTTARNWLGKATSRIVYHFDDAIETPPAAITVARERHAKNMATELQVAVEYSDGNGNSLVKKGQAEPDPTDTRTPPPLRWIASGKTVLNNKGKPVKQYEPYFSETEHRFDPTESARDVGVTPLLFHDALGRLIRAELPEGTHSRVEFSPWHVASFDANDTVLDSQWHADRGSPQAADPQPADPAIRAAWLAAHHANTPSLVLLDSLGRNVISVDHNRSPDDNGEWQDARYLTFTKLDAEGKVLWVRDARGNLVTQHLLPNKPTRLNDDAAGDAQLAGSTTCYDIAGNLLYQHGMDDGDRWTLYDGAGKPFLAWDINWRTLDDGSSQVERRIYLSEHDGLRRLRRKSVGINAGAPALIEAFDFLDVDSFIDAAGNLDLTALTVARANNLISRGTAHYDASGLTTIERFDSNGAAEFETRTLVADVTQPVVNWNVSDRSMLLEPETFRRITERDALGRMTRFFNWHRDATPGQSERVAVYIPRYNARGLLEAETIHVRASKVTDANGVVSFVPDAAQARNVAAIRHLEWDVKGRRSRLELGNGTVTRYTYDSKTLRLERLATDNGVQNLRYTYDAVGNLTRIQDDAQDVIWFANAQVDASSDYTYDALYRLIAATGRENSAAQGPPSHVEGDWPIGPMPSADAVGRYEERFEYDEVGNFVESRHHAPRQAGQPSGDWVRRYAVAADSNRLARTWNASDPAGATIYRYDFHGNALNLANTAPAMDIRWDYRDMIRALDLQGGGRAYYSYDSDKQRTRKQLIRGGTLREDRIYLEGYELYRRYTGDPTDPVEEIESLHLFEGEQRVLLIDDVIRTRKPRPDGADVAARTLFRYQYGNHLGSACVELDADADIISYEEFRPFGTSAYRAMNSAIEAPPKRYRYSGMERDEESGLNYHGARYFSAALGTWMSADPAGLADGLNRYAYCRNRPTDRIDTAGTQSKPTGADLYIEDKKLRLARAQLERAYERTGYIMPFKDDGYTPSQALTVHQRRRAPGTALEEFVSDFDRARMAAEEHAKLQLRAAALVAAVGVTIIAPEVVALLGAEGSTFAAFLLGTAEASSQILGTYATKGEVTRADVAMAAFSGVLRGRASWSPPAPVAADKILKKASAEFQLLRQTTDYLESKGFDEVERRLLIESGFRGSLDASTPQALAHFERTLVNELGLRDIGELGGRLGDLDSRVALIMKARDLEMAGAVVKFEVSVGEFAGRSRYLDIGVYRDGKLVEGYQGVKQYGLSDPSIVNPREVGLAGLISKGIGVPVHELNTGIQRPLP